MKNRWIGTLVLAAAVALGACAPAQQGAGETPGEAAGSAEPLQSMSVDSPSAAPSDDAGGNPDPTDYDY